MSLFLAISPPESIREQIATTIQDKDIAKRLWERKSDLHITLLYLQKGNPKIEYLQSIKERLETFSCLPFSLAIIGVNLWTLKENYHVLHLQVTKPKELITLQFEIVSLFPEVRKSIHEFTPHISLLRSSEISEAKVEELRKRFSAFSTESFSVNQIHLYKGEKDSESNKRNRYRIIESFPVY